MLEIDVDVRRLVALARDETFEQHFHPRRIDRGDAEAIAHRGIGRRAAALAENALLSRVIDNVVHREEKRLVARLGDKLELVLDQASHFPTSVFRRAAGGKAAGKTFLGQLA